MVGFQHCNCEAKWWFSDLCFELYHIILGTISENHSYVIIYIYIYISVTYTCVLTWYKINLCVYVQNYFTPVQNTSIYIYIIHEWLSESVPITWNMASWALKPQIMRHSDPNINQSITFRQRVDAQLDLREVARTQLSTYPVEPDAFAQSDLLDDAVVLAEVPGQPLEGRHLSVSTHLPHWRGVGNRSVGALMPDVVRLCAAAVELRASLGPGSLIVTVLLTDAMHLFHFQLRFPCCRSLQGVWERVGVGGWLCHRAPTYLLRHCQFVGAAELVMNRFSPKVMEC